MSKISRTDPGTILSKAVEYHGFVYLQGVTAKDYSKDIKGQTAEVLAQIDELLEAHGTDKTRILSATIYLADMKDYASMNAVWDNWVPQGETPARATVEARLANPAYRVEMQVVAAAG